jgi:hypothetical protein
MGKTEVICAGVSHVFDCSDFEHGVLVVEADVVSGERLSRECVALPCGLQS